MVAELDSLCVPNTLPKSLELSQAGQSGLPRRPSVGPVLETNVKNCNLQIVNKKLEANLPPQWRPTILLWLGLLSSMVMWASTGTGDAVSKFTTLASETTTATLQHLERSRLYVVMPMRQPDTCLRRKSANEEPTGSIGSGSLSTLARPFPISPISPASQTVHRAL